MNSFLKLITIIFTIYVVRCRETARNSKSVNEKIIYDCVDIYKQPSLTHPLLQNHKIQVSIHQIIFLYVLLSCQASSF
ncbi:hypothetical protein F2Q70_00014165 [Brassica cretica]|uniref:Neprosin activation peptide domain-containing protein n=1 Tax=Brassica cretica TaxID=69181 RepID=A0A8S9QK47_BRACR|nr:hypothetical protein F2Q70_00014165 [Brassica cretica]KAF2599018.1 hypothetical protein F2Q68_00007200 [Brassica cretica]KAF3538604.1 hypothetical protein F2Q69_00018626 [Brassica cretica]